MMDWLKQRVPDFRSWKVRVIIATIILVGLASVFISSNIAGYAVAIGIFYGLYRLSKQAQRERPISPKEKLEAVNMINELEEEALFIEEHLAEHANDLEAKLMVRGIREQIEEIKKEYGIK